MWRDKYISRFLEKKEDELDTPTDNSFEDLFEEEED